MDRRGVALICPLCYLLAYTINCFHPPYYALVAAFIVARVANGPSDSAWNAGEKILIFIYIVLQILFSFIVWLVPDFYVAAVGVVGQGFFLGPLFPAVVYACVRLLPEDLHVTVIGVTTGFSSLGAALLPFLVGAIADTQGMNSLPPFILGLSSAIITLWVCLPKAPRKLKNSKRKTVNADRF